MIIVGMGMIVFMGMAALAIDLGRGYSERRSAQNAADAAALAGMRLVRAPTSTTMTGADVFTSASAVARQNGVPSSPNGVVDVWFLGKNPSAPASSSNPDDYKYTLGTASNYGVTYGAGDYSDIYAVRVGTSITDKTFFAGLLGVSQVTSGGLATAMALKVNPSPTLMPVALQSHSLGTCSGTTFGYTVGQEYTFFNDGSNIGSQFGWVSLDGSGDANSLISWLQGNLPANFQYYPQYRWDGKATQIPLSYDTTACEQGFYHDGTGSGTDPTSKPDGTVLVTSISDCDGGSGDCDLKGSEPLSSSPSSSPIPVQSWFIGNSGISTSVQDEIRKLVGSSVTIMIYNKKDKISGGGNIRLQIVGWAGFTVTGVNISGSNTTIKGRLNQAVVGSIPTPAPAARSDGFSTIRLVSN